MNNIKEEKRKKENPFSLSLNPFKKLPIRYTQSKPVPKA